jgi:hypothetical protein
MKFQLTSETLLPFVVSNAVAVVTLWLSFRRRGTASGIQAWLLFSGLRSRIACAGRMLFGLLIAPLGIGSALPSTLVMSAAFLVLFVNEKEHSSPGKPIYDY